MTFPRRLLPAQANPGGGTRTPAEVFDDLAQALHDYTGNCTYWRDLEGRLVKLDQDDKGARILPASVFGVMADLTKAAYFSEFRQMGRNQPLI